MRDEAYLIKYLMANNHRSNGDLSEACIACERESLATG